MVTGFDIFLRHCLNNACNTYRICLCLLRKSFCGLAALKLLGKERICNIDSLTYWLVNKQMKFEGGFQGRTNKLVDACYSFWQAGMFPIIHSVLMKGKQRTTTEAPAVHIILIKVLLFRAGRQLFDGI